MTAEPAQPVSAANPVLLQRLANLRDLGGIPVAGGVLRDGLVLRADDVSTTTDEQGAELRAAGVTTVIDLRSGAEAAFTGRGVLAGDDVDYHHLPLTAEVAVPMGPDQGIRALKTPDAVGAWYAQLARGDAGTIVRGLEAVAASSGTVVFHCAAGKDRTGVFAASLLAVLGADDDAIVDDYARTDTVMVDVLARLEPFWEAFLGDAHTKWDEAEAGAILAAPAASMRAMLDVLGGADELRATLVAGGLDDATIAALRARLVA